MAIQYQQVSRDAARALEEFSDEFRSALALGDIEQWAGALGYVRTTAALKTTFPIPLDAAGYSELKGDIEFRRLYHRSLSMVSKEWADGVQEKARVIEAPDFIDWAGAPSRMAAEWQRLPQTLVATMLATSSYDGPLLDFYRDSDTNAASTRRLFAADHPHNVLDDDQGSFGNTATTTVAEINSGKFFKDISAKFRAIKGPNGKPLGLRFASILAPGAREQLFLDATKNDAIIRAIKNDGSLDPTANAVAAVAQANRFKGALDLTIGDELTHADYVYCFASGRPGLYPWVVQTEGAPEEVLHDKSSELYKRSRMVAVGYVGAMNVAACLPHGIIRAQITG